jgi:hypothetical protein
MSEKRKETRVPVELWIEVSRSGELYFQRAANLSVGGVFFDQTIPLPVSTRVALKFSLPGENHEIVCEGDIVAAKELGMGVQFVGLVAADKTRIEKLISYLVSKTK